MVKDTFTIYPIMIMLLFVSCQDAVGWNLQLN